MPAALKISDVGQLAMPSTVAERPQLSLCELSRGIYRTDVMAAELVVAIRRAAKGEATLHPRVAARLIKQFSQGEPQRRNLFTELTDREMEVLKLVARTFSNQKIADELVITVGTVKGHVSNILSKLHLADRTQAAVLAWQEGIVQRD